MQFSPVFIYFFLLRNLEQLVFRQLVIAFLHSASSRKVAGSILDGVIGIFHWHHPWGHTMALGLTQPLTEMSIRNISWGVKVAGA